MMIVSQDMSQANVGEKNSIKEKRTKVRKCCESDGSMSRRCCIVLIVVKLSGQFQESDHCFVNNRRNGMLDAVTFVWGATTDLRNRDWLKQNDIASDYDGKY